MNNITRLTAISFIAFMAGGVIGPVSSLYSASLGANFAAIGFLGTVTSLTAILLSYVWGRASDYFGRRKIFLLFGLFALAASNGLMAMVPRYEFLFPLRMMAGIGLSAYATSSLALMGDVLERHAATRGRRMGLYRGLGSLGFGIMAFLSGSIADRFSLRAPFVLAASLYAVASLFALGMRESTAGSAPATHRTGFLFVRTLAGAFRTWIKRVATKRVEVADPDASPGVSEGGLPLAPLLISAFAWSLVTGAVYAVWANYMVADLGYTPTVMSRLWSLASTSEFPLMILAGWLSDRLGRLPMLTLSFVAWTLVFAGYILVPGMPWIVFVQLTRGFAYSAFTASAMTYAIEVRKRSQRGAVSGLYNASGSVGAILGASMGGIQTQLMGFRAMIGTNASLIFGGALYLAGVIIHRSGTGRRRGSRAH